MSIKKEYYKSKITLEQKKLDRDIDAHREIETIIYLLREFYNTDLKKGSRILDLGAGDKFLKQICIKKNFFYDSLDVEDLDFEKDKFKFEDNYFDLVVSLAVLEHLSNPSIFIEESKRVLKNGSCIFLSTPNWKYSKDSFFDDVTHVKPYSPNSLNQLLELKGFRDIKTMPNLRCKKKWWYEGKFKFFKAYYLLPFKGDTKFVPNFLKGKSRGLFAIGKK